ncbi:SGNH/GDSL hydrolase family protein [Photobacterium minamisatsumaniensis]|uniref:SGNH/GDSL hydrolase family protein n=1 Tax=Photobacterium minamisatsumaniensis TaxID=2910233 RepID=UPI003D09B0C3
MIHQIVLLLMAPVLLPQALYVRKSTPRLKEAAGSRNGVAGSGKNLRLLLIGDSAAAGVGAEHQSQALAGRVVNALSDSFQLDWQLIAKTGVTTKQTCKKIAQQSKQDFDIVIVSLGVNDVTKPLSSTEWIKQQKELIELIRQSFSSQQIILTKIPPMEKFPALPHPLRWYLGSKAKTFNRKLEHWVATQNDCELIHIEHDLGPQHMASDGFHPGPAIYDVWGSTVADVIKSRW